MLQKLGVLEDKYKDLTEKISDPEIINDQKTWQKFMKEHADLEPIIMKFRLPTREQKPFTFSLN